MTSDKNIDIPEKRNKWSHIPYDQKDLPAIGLFFKELYMGKGDYGIMGTFFIGATTIASINLLQIAYQWSLIIKITFLALFIFHGIRYKIISKNNYREIRYFINKRKTSTV